MVISANLVAKFFLAQQNPEAGELVSHLKLQKLCYYAQGVYLARYGEALFPEAIEAWKYGPVVADLYPTYREYGRYVIDPPTDFDPTAYDDRTLHLLNEVWQSYGQFSAWKLAEMTHRDPPYMRAWENGEGSEISPGAMREHFSRMYSQTDHPSDPQPFDKIRLIEFLKADADLVEQTMQGEREFVAGRFSRLE